MFKKILLISGCLGLSSSQNVLFRNDALVSRTEVNTPLLGRGSISHHSKTVSDATSTVHRHQTHTTNPVVRLVSSPASLPHFINSKSLISQRQALQQSLSGPVLLQHNDGRFFALNANLQPGQVFQTADGRIFTLDSGRDLDSSIVAARDEILDDDDENEDVELLERGIESTTATTTTTTTTPITTTAAPTTTTTTESNAAPRDNTRSTSIIASAPLTPSTAQFVAVQPFNDIRAISSPVTHIATPLAHAATTIDQVLTHAVPVGRVVSHAAPVGQVVTHASAPVSRVVTHAAPVNQVVTHAAAPIGRLVTHAAAPVSQVVRGVAPIAHTTHVTSPVATVSRGHLLADSKTPVFQGFFSFPKAGIDFNF